MPVYHQLQTFEKPVGEYPGLIDGMIPEDHTLPYSSLKDLRCVETYGTIYQRVSDNFRICYDCYLETPEEQQFEYEAVVKHCLVYRRAAYSKTNCAECGVLTIKIIDAAQCRRCIEDYLDADLDTLYNQEELPVVRVWNLP